LQQVYIVENWEDDGSLQYMFIIFKKFFELCRGELLVSFFNGVWKVKDIC